MFLIRRPSEAEIADYLARQTGQPLSYESLDSARDISVARRGWNIDRKRVLLGHGQATFDLAKAAINRWQMFPSSIATVLGVAVPREGLVVGVLFHPAPLPLWILMAARVIGLVDERQRQGADRTERYGFVYGTLPDHPERGEERFLVEWQQTDNSVWYDLLAVSQPAHWLARIGYPYTRFEQARFRRLSCAAMRQAVAITSVA